MGLDNFNDYGDVVRLDEAKRESGQAVILPRATRRRLRRTEGKVAIGLWEVAVNGFELCRDQLGALRAFSLTPGSAQNRRFTRATLVVAPTTTPSRAKTARVVGTPQYRSLNDFLNHDDQQRV